EGSRSADGARRWSLAHSRPAGLRRWYWPGDGDQAPGTRRRGVAPDAASRWWVSRKVRGMVPMIVVGLWTPILGNESPTSCPAVRPWDRSTARMSALLPKRGALV